MDKKEFLRILDKYERGEATAEGIDFLHAYYQLFELQQDAISNKGAGEQGELKARIKRDLDALVAEHGYRDQVGSAKQHWLNNRLWIAALLAAVIGAFIYWYQQGSDGQVLQAVIEADDDTMIRPGKDDAILTLGDGKEIVLNDAENGTISEENGIRIEKTIEGELIYHITGGATSKQNTIQTPKGGQYRLVLSDGSRVWLNAASSLSFPSTFEGQGERLVTLHGEAYFEVEKGEVPFKVKSDHQIVEVMGTDFNINTYKEESAGKTTLVSGSVRINRLTDGLEVDLSKSKVLRPGQQAWLSPSNANIAVQQVDVEEAVAWKKGYFKFEKADIQTIMRQVARWYNVEVEYRGALSKDLFVGEIDRSEDIEEVLNVLRMGQVNVQIEGKKVIVSADGNN